MKKVFKFVVGNPGIFLPIAVALFVGYNVAHGPIAEILGVCSGLILGTLAHHHWLSAHIEHERHQERSATIEQLAGLKSMGLVQVTASRDGADRGFFSRAEEFKPRTHISIVGITARFLAVEKREQLGQLLRENSRLHIKVCVLHPDSPCAVARGEEMGRPTRRNVAEAIAAWSQFATDYPRQVTVRVSIATPYTEGEGYDFDLEATDFPQSARLYLTPVAYKAETNVTPSFLLSGSSSLLFRFWVSQLRVVWKDACPPTPEEVATWGQMPNKGMEPTR